MSFSSRLKPLRLHAHSSGPNPYKVAIILEALHLPYLVRLWEFGDDPKTGVKGAAFLRINENGRVPALEDPNTGVTAWESGAIVAYLLREYDSTNSSKLGPNHKSKQDMVDYDKWIAFLLSTLGPMTGQVNWFKHYNAVSNDDAVERYEAQTYRCYDVLEKQLRKSQGRSVLPTGFSAVDAHFYPWLFQYGFAGLSLASFPHIAKYLEVIGERREVKAAYKAIENATET